MPLASWFSWRLLQRPRGQNVSASPTAGRSITSEFACLQLPSGPELAQCDMVLNISSWKKIQSGCPEATAPLSVLVEGGEQQSGEAGHKALTTTNTPT
ncbi:hypothetical protein [Mesorhizobium sp. M0701]|uniref:hypothetical protein n=1 Tax=Mesorhizobium sp. M0701 TaxID=2956989 RepID=UPI0033375588